MHLIYKRYRVYIALIFGVYILCFFSFPAFAQQSRLYTESIAIKDDTIRLSNQFIVPFSEKLSSRNQENLQNNQYNIHYPDGFLILTNDSIKDSIHITYRYFIQGLKSNISLGKLRISVDSSGNQHYQDDWENLKESEKDQFFWETSQIQKSGSLERGLTMGNNRSVSVNSGLRLQLEGDLGDGLKVVGAITDENIPIQPDGTTQQINDLDKIFVKLMKDNYSLTIGDFEVQNKKTRFSNFYRNVQGLQLAYTSKKHNVALSGAVAKGKFHSNSFIGLEGISGPYQLAGKNGERFFFVLAGSERVYLNGRLMARGEQEDYIIDYNTASITFTAKHVITSVSRIVVDFEYNDQNFNRSLMLAQTEHKLANDKLQIRLSYVRDADNPNAPFDDADAFNEVRSQLASLGDSPQGATTSGVNDIGFSDEENQVRYIRNDTIIDTNNYERYIFSTDSMAKYKITFSYVGPNQGFYQRDNRGINKVIYSWVPPAIDGTPQGDYAPIRRWVLPKLLQVANAAVDYQLTDNLSVYSETAISSEDLNRLSNLDDEDNVDIANKTGIKIEKLNLGDSLNLSVDLSHQYVGARYTNIDRVYQAEYNRLWNLTDQHIDRRNERIGAAKVQLNYKNKLRWQAETAYRNVGQGRTAYRQVYSISSYWPKWMQGNYTFTQIQNKDEHLGRFSKWLRHEGDIFQPLGKFRLGTELWAENRNEERNTQMSEGTFSFFDIKPYIRTFQTEKFQMDASINYRKEKAYINHSKLDKSLAYTYYLRWALRPSNQFQFQHIFSYRDFQLLDTAFVSEGLNDTRLVQTNLQMRYFSKNRAVRTDFVYEVSSEGVAKRDIMFVEVNPGQGQYEYIEDINHNGIQDLDEFQLSTNPLAANYVRILIPSRELFPTSKLNLNGSFRLDFKYLINKSNNKLKELLRNTRFISQVRVNQSKERTSGIESFLINISNLFADSSLLNANSFFRQELSFFPNNPLGELKVTYFDNKTKLFLSTGDELRSLNYWSFRQRLNIGENKSIEHEFRLGNKRSEAELFPSRNFNLQFVETAPQINFQLSRKLRLTGGYTYKFKKNITASQEVDTRINMHKFAASSRWNITERNNISGRLEFIHINQKGEATFSGQYELREGLQTGANAIWQLLTSYYLLENVELSINYDGRVSTEKSVIHTGRMQIRAFF